MRLEYQLLFASNIYLKDREEDLLHKNLELNQELVTFENQRHKR